MCEKDMDKVTFEELDELFLRFFGAETSMEQLDKKFDKLAMIMDSAYIKTSAPIKTRDKIEAKRVMMSESNFGFKVLDRNDLRTIYLKLFGKTGSPEQLDDAYFQAVNSLNKEYDRSLKKQNEKSIERINKKYDMELDAISYAYQEIQEY